MKNETAAPAAPETPKPGPRYRGVPIPPEVLAAGWDSHTAGEWCRWLDEKLDWGAPITLIGPTYGPGLGGPIDNGQGGVNRG